MSGNVDLSAKICAVKAKHCLILLCIDHVLAFLLATGGVIYVYMSGGIFMDEGYLINLIPPVLALFSGIGAICCLFLKKKLLMAICVAWPVILCLAATVFYGIMIYTVATWNSHGLYGRIDTVNLILTMLGIIVIPLSCCCCVVLGCLGCIIKSPDGSSNGSTSGTTTPSALKSKQGKSNTTNAGNTGPTNGNGNNQGNGQWNGNGGMMNQNQMPNNQNQNQNPNWNQNQNNQNPNQNQMQNQMQNQNQNPNNQNWNQNPNQNQMANQNGNNWNGNQVQGRPNQGNQHANNGGVNNQGMHHKNHSQHFWN